MPLNPGTKITHGFDRHFFQREVVSSTSFGDDADGYANIIIPIRGNDLTISMINEGSNTIEYSFNGNTLHGDLVPNTPSEALLFERINYCKIWFRATVAGGSTIRVEAWGR